MAATLLLAAVLALASDKPRFDLICEGTQAVFLQDVKKWGQEPFSERIRVDTEKRLYCEADCSTLSKVQDVTPDEYVFFRGSDGGRHSRGKVVGRATGTLEQYDGGQNVSRRGLCKTAPFSGFPRKAVVGLSPGEPVLTKAPSPPQRPMAGKLIEKPDWIRTPTQDDVVRFYPDQALARSIRGTAKLSCSVSPSGSLEGCNVISETPGSLGFGDTALRLSRIYRMRPYDARKRPVVGGLVRLNMTFEPPRSATSAEAQKLASELFASRPGCDAAYQTMLAAEVKDFAAAAVLARPTIEVCSSTYTTVAALQPPASSEGKNREAYVAVIAECALVYRRKAELAADIAGRVRRTSLADLDDLRTISVWPDRWYGRCREKYVGLAAQSSPPAPLKASR